MIVMVTVMVKAYLLGNSISGSTRHREGHHGYLGSVSVFQFDRYAIDLSTCFLNLEHLKLAVNRMPQRDWNKAASQFALFQLDPEITFNASFEQTWYCKTQVTPNIGADDNSAERPTRWTRTT